MESASGFGTNRKSNPVRTTGDKDRGPRGKAHIGLEVTVQQHALFCRAADHLGLNLSGFVRMACMEKSREILRGVDK